MLRRSFLRSLALNAAGLYVAPDALEAILEPRRKYWPGWSGAPGTYTLTWEQLDAAFRVDLSTCYSAVGIEVADFAATSPDGLSHARWTVARA